MPRRKPQRGWTVADLPASGRDSSSDLELVRHALVDIDDLAGLDDQRRAALERDLAYAVGFWRAGVNIGRRGISNEFTANGIFFADVINAIASAGLRAGRWSQQYDGGTESLLYRVARALGETCGFRLPSDLKRVAKLGQEISENKKG